MPFHRPPVTTRDHLMPLHPAGADPAAGDDHRRHRLRRRRGHPGRPAHLRACSACTAASRSPRSPCRTRWASRAFTRSRSTSSPGRSRPSSTTSASRPPRPGMLASSEIIGAVAETWRGLRPGLGAPLVVDPVCASMHGDPLLHPSALDALRTELFPLATLVTPNLDEVRLITGIDVVDAATQRDAARALHALGPAVGAGQGRAPAVVVAQPRPAVRRHRVPRVRRRAHRHRPRPRRG